jgi:SAM-dependent methyltransferase
MGHYTPAAEYYDLIYGAVKDYRAESELLASLIHERRPGARTVLDVACGTGGHARWLSELGFEVTGVDLEPVFVEMARAKCPRGRFSVADMTELDLGETFDVVVCLFSAIGYVRTVEALGRTLVRLARHLEPEGVLVIDPWFAPGQLTHGNLRMLTGEQEGLVVCRIGRTLIDGVTSTLEMHYLIGRPEGIEHREERHELGLFTQREMEEAFRSAALSVTRLPEVLRTRGIYVGMREP